MHGGALRTHQIRHDDVQDGRRRAEADRPFQVSGRGIRRCGVRSQQNEKGIEKDGEKQGKQEPADNRAIKPERGALVHHLVIPAAERTAHHAGTPHTEQVVHSVERQQNRCGQRDGGVLHRIVQHADKICIRQIVKHHDQRAEDGRDRQRHDGSGNRLVFEQIYLFLVFSHRKELLPGGSGPRPAIKIPASPARRPRPPQP